MNKFLITITSILALTACTPNAINEQKVDNTPSIQKPQEINKPNQTLTAKDIKHPQGKTATPSEIAECQKQGGTISPQGLLAHDFCVVEFADKGKVCTDGGDCQAGRCIAKVNSSIENSSQAKGVCPSNNVPFGCYGTVNKGQFGGFLCVD
ncbi:Uncharacterised protein [Moraxella lacunata]|uniref:Secreted protein n=1 Tax=Moraxella lacunata TaxID=477 RepID=A0A378TUP9_MORLA|nr:hypothetical protein [Moraxella lacunata]STZ64004.1 Uncharacterised protein [Moraxella lacunata]